MLTDTPDGEPVRKQRDDHRHHAIDAFVVANTTQGLFQEFSRAAGSSYANAEERLANLAPLPWEGFHRNELAPFLDKMVVSYRPDHGTRGKKANGATTGNCTKPLLTASSNWSKTGHQRSFIASA